MFRTRPPRVTILAGCAVALAAILPAITVHAGTPAARGKLLFLRCASCHNITPTGSEKIGPSLYHVVGRESGSLPGYTYSTAMQNAHLVWNPPTLDRWLTSPGALVPGTAMAFGGLPSAQDRQAVIAYLESQQ
jgi:cytochrome c